MGNWFCGTKEDLQQLNIEMVGLDLAGKATIRYNMKLGEVITAIPTIGLDGEVVKINGVALTCWDFSSRGSMRALWRHYYPGTLGFVFVIDSAESELEMNVLTSEATDNSVIMILANKQDKEGAMTAQEIEHLLMEKGPYRKHCMQPFCVMPGSTFKVNQILEGFSDFAELMIENSEGKAKRGLITFEEREAELAQSHKAESGLALKLLLRSCVQYFKAFFE